MKNLGLGRVDEEDETEGHFDRVIALAICWQLRIMATATELIKMKDMDEEKGFDKHVMFNEF